MNSNVLLIAEDTLKTYSNLNKNTFGDWILPAILEAQEMGLMPIIGECLYNKICELVADGSINDVLFTAYKDLLDDKIQPYLIYKTLSNIIPILNAKMANLGVVVTNDEHVVNLTQSESDLLKSYYSERCDFYTKRLQDFIKSNQSAFPEISCSCGKMQPNLESSENSVGVWLGGSRGKKIGNNNCICSSTEVTHADYQSGFTDGVEFQKRKLEITAVTENGRYIREDGYSEVVVDVPQTGHTDEEMRQQYDNGYGDGETHQKALLSAITITQNGSYERENGYSAVTVDVPQTGHTDEELKEAYNSGYTSGETHQKTLLSTVTLTQNGSYKRADGYSAVTVDVPQTGHTDEELEEAYQNGKTVGVSEQKSKLSAITITQNGDYNREDGYSAITVNVSGQEPSLVSTAITANGKYFPSQGYDGFSSVEVNVSSGKEIVLTGDTTLIGYGRYYFDYDENTEIPNIIINFVSTGTTGITVMNYTSTDGNLVTPNNINQTVMGRLISNTYENGIGTFVFDKDIEVLNNYLFADCETLRTITLPNKLKSIGADNVGNVFASCHGLTEITIPSSVTSISNSSFFDCRSLTSVTCLSETPPSLGSGVFAISDNVVIYVPAASVDAYKTAKGWSEYADRIQAIA